MNGNNVRCMTIDVLKFVGSAIYSILLSYFLWIGFCYITPDILDIMRDHPLMSLVGYFIFIILFALSGTLMAYPLAKTTSRAVCKILPVMALLYFGYASVMLPWQMGMQNHGMYHLISGIIIDFNVVIVYGLFLIFVIKGIKNEK